MTLKLTIFSEHIWGYLKNKIHQHCPKNKEEVWHYAQIEWKKIPVALCKKLCYDNYMNRIKAVVESKGKHTKYWLIVICYCWIKSKYEMNFFCFSLNKYQFVSFLITFYLVDGKSVCSICMASVFNLQPLSVQIKRLKFVLDELDFFLKLKKWTFC